MHDNRYMKTRAFISQNLLWPGLKFFTKYHTHAPEYLAAYSIQRLLILREPYVSPWPAPLGLRLGSSVSTLASSLSILTFCWSTKSLKSQTVLWFRKITSSENISRHNREKMTRAQRKMVLVLVLRKLEITQEGCRYTCICLAVSAESKYRRSSWKVNA